MAKTLAQRLDALTNAQLADVYNSVAERHVTKFSDHSTAVKRTQLALEAVSMDFTVDGDTITVGPLRSPGREGDARIITVMVEKNPKTLGSKSHARFGMYKTGMTVGDYVAAVIRSGRARRLAIRDITWDREHGYITVD